MVSRFEVCSKPIMTCFFSKMLGSTLYSQPVALKIDFPKIFLIFVIIGNEWQQCNTSFQENTYPKTPDEKKFGCLFNDQNSAI